MDLNTVFRWSSWLQLCLQNIEGLSELNSYSHREILLVPSPGHLWMSHWLIAPGKKLLPGTLRERASLLRMVADTLLREL